VNVETVFESQEWTSFLAEYFGYRLAPIDIELSGKNLRIAAFETERRFRVFRVLYSIPPYYYGGIYSNEWITKKDLLQVFDRIRKNPFLHSLTVAFHPVNQCSLFEGVEIEKYLLSRSYTHVLELPNSYSSLWEDIFDDKQRNQLRKAMKCGVEVVAVNSDEAIGAYYDIYLESAKRWGLARKEPIEFFVKLRERLAPYFQMLLAKIGDKWIAGIILLSYKDKVFYFHASSLSDYWKFNGNSLLLSHGIKMAIENSKRLFDFLPSGRLRGVEAFKESFGATKRFYNVYRVNGSLYAACGGFVKSVLGRKKAVSLGGSSSH